MDSLQQVKDPVLKRKKTYCIEHIDLKKNSLNYS